MSNPLSVIQRTGQKPKPPRIMLYGPHKIGKTTFAAQAPAPIFIQIEDGLDAIDAQAFPRAESYDQVIEQLDMLGANDHQFQTLAVDSLDWFERLVWAKVCANNGVKNIEDIGYGKGYVQAVDLWKAFLERINGLRDVRGMASILLAHAEVKRFDAPDKTQSYDRYQPKLHKAAGALVSEAVDVIGFANYEVHVVKTEIGFKKEKATGTGSGARALYLEERPAFVAGSRYRMPEKIPLDWSAFAAAFNAAMTPQSSTQAA